MPTTRTRSTGEKGVAVVITALCLLPLMIFAAFGVDLASWHSRISYIQKSADAAALAGTVWMPDIGEATAVACESLARNGIVGNAESDDCQGAGGEYRINVEPGSRTITRILSLRTSCSTERERPITAHLVAA